MTNIQKLMKMGQQVQARIQEVQESLESEEITASSGGGMVTAKVSGKGDIKGLTIDPTTIDPDDPEMLEDLIVAAIAQAQRRARVLSEDSMKRAAGGLPFQLPGLF